MRIRFDVGVEDFVYFNKFTFGESKQLKNAVLRNQIIFAIAAVGILGALSYGTRLWWLFMPIAALLSVGYAFWLKWFVARRLERTTRELVGRPENQVALGEHEIEVLEDGIRTRGRTSEGTTSWSGLTRLVRGGEYALIFAGTSAAHVIRKASVVEGDVEALLDAIEKGMAGSRGATGRPDRH